MKIEEQEYNDHEMTWESEARLAISRAIENCEKDEIRGHIYLWTREDHPFDRIQEEFPDYNSLYYRLTEIGETEWVNYVPWDKGPVFEPSVDGYVCDAIEEIGAEDFFFGKSSEKEEDTLFDASELLTPEGAKLFRVDVEEISEKLIRHLAKNPKELHELTSRKFEELVAELFKDMGYEVELTPASKDGGFDIRAVRKTEVGIGLYFIECKRYSTKNKVGVGIVRNLYGIVESEKATSGLVVTTSFFTKGAFDFREKNKYRLALADQNLLKEYLQNYKKILG